MLAVPPALLEILRVQSGDTIDITVEKGRLVAEPQKHRRYTLDELLAQCHARGRRTREEREWVSDRLAGDELV